MVADYSPSPHVTADSLLDEVGVLVAVVSPDGVTDYVNGEFLRKTGASAEEAIGRPFEEGRWFAHQGGLSAKIRAAIDQAALGRATRMDVELAAGPAQRVIIEFDIRPTRAGNGVRAVVVEGHDVSAQRAVERKLREAHFRWRTIADFTVDWEYWLHPGGQFLYSSPACQRICGYAAEEFTEGRMTLPGLASPEDRKHVMGLLTQAFSGSTGHSQRWRLVRRDGQLRWVSMSWQPVHGEDGRFMGVRGSVRDVTEMAIAEQEIQRTLEAYRTLARHFPKGMVALLDRQMQFVVLDGPALQVLQLDGTRLLGKSLLDILDSSILPAVRTMCREALSGREVSSTVQYGPTTWLVHFTPIPDGDGKITQIIASAVESADGWPEDAEQAYERSRST